MRWFWLFILSLCALTGGLYAQRTSAERAEQARLQAEAETARESASPRRRRGEDRAEPNQETAQPTPETRASEQPATAEQEPIVQQDVVAEPVLAQTDAESEPIEESQPGTPKGGFEVDGLLSTLTEIGEQLPPEEHRRAQQPSTEIKPAQAQAKKEPEAVAEPDPAPVGEIVIDLPDEPASSEPAPMYEQRGDGSFRVIDANAWVQGAGTAAEPYVLTWDVLKSIEKHYDPKSGKDTLPDWLDLLDGKVVSIEGNTLVPVVASTTRELLVMQNPWDGCCIGVPPTPYDAVEVSLSHDVDFGSSAVGFGSVQGTFYTDPYVVDGWVLGVYIIEDAKYRSGEGVVFPEF